MAHRNQRGEWRASPLTSLRSGHLALSLFQPSVRLSSLIRPPHDRPDHGDRGGPERDGGDGDRDGPEEPGDGPHLDDGDGPGRNKRTRSETSVRSASGPATGPSETLDAAVMSTVEGNINRDAMHRLGHYATETLAAQNFNELAMMVESPINDVPNGLITDGDYTPESPIERPFPAGVEGSRSASFTRSGGVTENETSCGDDVASHQELDEETGTWRPVTTHVMTEEGSHDPQHEHGHEHAPQHGHGHENGRDGNVLMVMMEPGEEQPMTERLSCLAQRLQALRSELNVHQNEHGGKAMSSCDAPRPTTPRVALQWDAHPWPHAPEQVRKVACMQEMWPEVELHHERHLPGRDTCHWTRSSTCGSCPTGVEGAVRAYEHEREDLQWQTDGDSWPWSGANWWSWTNYGRDQGRRAPWEVPHGRLQHDGSWYGFNYNADYANSGHRASAEEFNQEQKMPSATAIPKAVAKAKVHVKKEPMAPVTPKAAPSTPATEPPKEVIIHEVDDVLTVVSSEEEG